MLALLYLAAVACNIPVLEKDVILGAQQNKFGYFTAYLKTCPKFEQAIKVIVNSKPFKCTPINLEVLLRPINVAFKPKWLRETVRDLDKTLCRTYINI